MEYRETLKGLLRRELEVAEKARALGFDPEDKVEIKIANDLAERVEELVGPEGVAQRIRELSSGMDREELSLRIAMDIANGTIGEFSGDEERMFHAVRCGLAVLTEGVLVAPLEGLIKVKKGKNHDGSDYMSVFYAGPIRSAGGTAQAMSVLIADVVRREMGVGVYVPTEDEVERYKEEIPLYKRLQHLQYIPSNDEIDLIVRNCPICIDGEGTEKEEISGHKGLKRFETDRVRGGACLVIAEGMCLKARKLQKHVKKLGINGWDFINSLIEKADEEPEEEEEEEEAKYLHDVVGGRPVLSYPNRAGGFRLRYGRSRTSGLAACSLSPVVLTLLYDFLAIGTQIKTEMPGKAAAVSVCDVLEKPSVLLDNGDFIEVESADMAREIRNRIVEIVDLGEILISYGEFLENNRALLPSGYTEEWWEKDLAEKGVKKPKSMSFREALEISKRCSVPLHPSYNLFWNDVRVEDVRALRAHIARSGVVSDGKLIVGADGGIKRILMDLGVYHRAVNGGYSVSQHTDVLMASLGLEAEGGRVRESCADCEAVSALEYVSKMLGVEVKNRAPTRIGVRMGRPEKSKERLMRPPPHVLFPLQFSGGKQRLVNKAAEQSYVEVEVSVRRCPACEQRTYRYRCLCGSPTTFVGIEKVRIDLNSELQNAMNNLRERNIGDIKGVEGLISPRKEPEILEKGVLRAKRGLHVNKDGTLRYDMTDVTLTHFRPAEINVSLEKLREMGYEKDCYGRTLESTEQVVELMPQDIVVSRDCMDFLLKSANFIDDALEKIYGMEPYYMSEGRESIIGAAIVGLAPHTSAGVLGRVIGYTNANVCFAHPFFHAAKRRNCDGDEDSVMLLMDSLINFSIHYLPASRGGRMDCPLILTSVLDPREIDKEAWNVDIMYSYPLEFYRRAEDGVSPKDVSDMMDYVEKHLGSSISFGFSFDTARIDGGNRVSSYKVLETMQEKINLQMDLAKKIRAVDEADVAAKVINTHLLPDMLGNLTAFSKQEFRCTGCNTKYRRIPLGGRCTNCGKNLTLTVHKASVKKYLDISKEIIEEYDVPMYVKQCVYVAEASINSLFENVKKITLADFLEEK
jgi:DNA polymerase II large subunit